MISVLYNNNYYATFLDNKEDQCIHICGTVIYRYIPSISYRVYVYMSNKLRQAIHYKCITYDAWIL